MPVACEGSFGDTSASSAGVRVSAGQRQHYQATNAVMVTTSSYSKDAHALQKKHQYQLSLKDYVGVAEWIQRYGTNKNFKN